MNPPSVRPQAGNKAQKQCCCIKCGKELMNMDIALYKKMINRGAERFMCIRCLAEYIGVTEDDLLMKAEHFRKMGCTLFK